MCSKEPHLKFFWPYLLANKTTDQSCYSDAGIWTHQPDKLLLFTIYDARAARAELKILKLLMHSRRERGGIESNSYRRRGPSDAEIVFGNCDCKKPFCNRRPIKTGWDKSRIDWLWNLEQLERQDQLRYIWREHCSRKRVTVGSPVPSVIALRRSEKSQSKRIGCWSWLCPGCGHVSDIESLGVENSAISI